jgi:leucyl/phenylalanyl-tRNA---protein transferase
MPVVRFPNPEQTDENGIVGWGADLHPLTLESAYKMGIFPWPMEETGLIPWFCPKERAILEYSKLHLSRSLQKELKKNKYRYSVDEAFPEVIRECAKCKRKGQRGTWITEEMIDSYVALHKRKSAHSVEVWEGEKLVGGIYGVSAGGYFSGESMFHKKPNTSKFALIYLMKVLHEKGLNWLDIQVMTPHMKIMGARNISRKEFLKKIAIADKHFTL